jgi:peptide deformylase
MRIETHVILPIRTLGDPVLSAPAKPVTEFGRSLRRIVDDMVETMYGAPGVGLAAPQVGLSMRLFVLDDGETGPLAVANPELLDPLGEAIEDEGCLSIPGPFHPTARAASIRCRGVDAGGRPIELAGEGLLARILQHETDHLDGRLFIDRLDQEGRREVLAELRRIELGLAEPRPRPKRTRRDP